MHDNWLPIVTAPHDGTMVRLKLRRTAPDHEVRGRWIEHPEMRAGGFWSTADGRYLTPWPEFWAR